MIEGLWIVLAGVSFLAFLAWRTKIATLGGAAAGWFLAVFAAAGFGLAGVFLLAVFVGLASAATRFGQQRKIDRGIAQENRGRRGAKHAFANCGVASFAAVIASFGPDSVATTCAVAYAAALATALADSAASEIGQLTTDSTRMITGWREVAPGVDGAVSALGSLASILGAAVVGASGWLGGLYPLHWIPVICACGVVGCLADSLLGATLEARGVLDNQGVNFLATAIGASLATLLDIWMLA